MNEKKKVVNLDMKQYGMFLALIAIYVIFAIMTGGKNLSPANINNLIMQNGYVVILAIGMLLCVLTGNVDLGVGSVVALTGAAAVAGGAGTIMGAVVGAFIMGILNNGMSLYGWSTDIQKIVKGAVLLGAVTVDVISKRKKG